MSLTAWLSRPILALPANASCVEAARCMRRENVGSVVVEQDGAPVGIVTDRDLMLRVLAEELDPATVQLHSVMTKFLVFLTPQRELADALNTMRDMSVRRLPVVNAEGRVIGMLSLDDVVMRLAEQLGRVRDVLQSESRRTDEEAASD